MMLDDRAPTAEQIIADLRRERDEALAREAAIAEVLQVINASPGDLAPVFDVMLEKATALCEAAFGILRTWDGKRFHHVALRGVPPALRELWREPLRPSPGTVADRLVQGETLISVTDLREDPGYRAGAPGFRPLVELADARSYAAVALRKDGALMGALTVYRKEVRPFTDKQIALLQNFAAQAVIAMENARLLTETREALEQQTATAEVLQVINSSPGNLAPVFDAMLDKALGLCGAAFGVLWSYNGTHLYAEAHRGTSSAYAEVLSSGPYPADATGLTGRFLKGERFIHGDVAAGEGYRSGRTLSRALVDLDGGRTNLAVPLRREDALLGFIVIYRREVRPFTDKEIALLQNFAAQAVIAMENARLLTETREALEQQTATAELLGVINSSPGDLAPVFDAMLEKATSLCQAAHGNLWTYDGECFYPVATQGSPRFSEWVRQHGPVNPPPGSIFERLARGEDFVQIADAAIHNLTSSFSREVTEITGARTVLAVPLRKDNTLLGAIFAYRQELRPFSDKQIVLFQNFAAQAVIAMENARLITETREALEQQTATAEVLQVINSSPGDLAPVFQLMLEKALRLCDAAFGTLWTACDDSAYELAAHHGVSSELEAALRSLGPVQAHEGVIFPRLRSGESVIQFRDLATDAVAPAPRRVALTQLGGARSALWVALRKDAALLGVFIIYRQEVRPFTEKQIALLENFAAQAVIAIENARLLDELRQRTEEVAELNRGLEVRVAEQVEELGRVGRLRRFLAPQLAELIVSRGDEKILESHRREIVVVFCDLRGYTAFTETAEPEEVLDFLREYHGALGPLVSQYEGTLDQFSGDGIMVFFNDPVPIPDPAERAVKMAMAMREAAGALIAAWRRRGRVLGFGAGIAQGYATLGQIGFADRSGYTAIGTVCNLAARLCAEAKDGQILVGQRVAVAVEETIPLEEVGELTLKGLTQPVVAFNVPASAAGDAAAALAGSA
jgi:GAF domain-containing protein